MKMVSRQNIVAREETRFRLVGPSKNQACKSKNLRMILDPSIIRGGGLWEHRRDWTLA